MSNKQPSMDQIVKTAESVVDLVSAGETLVSRLETTAGVAHRLTVQRRKLKNAGKVMRPYHAWRVAVLEGKLREMLGLPFGAKLPV